MRLAGLAGAHSILTWAEGVSVADCEHTGQHLHCNICGGAPCAECFGSIAPSPDAFGMRRGPNIESVYQNKIAALRAQLAEEQARVKELEEQSALLRDGKPCVVLRFEEYKHWQEEVKRLRAWIESVGHKAGCASTRKCAHCGKPPWSYRHLKDAVGFEHTFQPAPCDCGHDAVCGGD